MKNHDVRSLVMLLLSLVFVAFVRADETAYRQILKERDAVLSKIIEVQEGRQSTGLADFEMASAARIALWNFRRDTAGTKEERIKLQELLVQEYEKNLSEVKVRSTTGVRTTLDVLLATDKLLEAKQVLAELRMMK